MSDYLAFLREKIKLATFKGFEVAPDELHPCLFPHQRDIVRLLHQISIRSAA